MRTNIVIDDELMAEAMELTGLKTKRAVVEKALQALIQLNRQGEIEDLFGRLHWEGDLNRIREDRVDYAG
ncbi:MAG TPA: type II toxin-antitoxin system VapB family antitoxin [Promineifilum sp.]|nr:type II toxin-antitoxin system VapB family antitoxin [Promineifilum sp.]HRQ15180.1 type II toxin-antitoxin system VapB family antitoxin [Promineifilum sp.]